MSVEVYACLTYLSHSLRSQRGFIRCVIFRPWLWSLVWQYQTCVDLYGCYRTDTQQLKPAIIHSINSRWWRHTSGRWTLPSVTSECQGERVKARHRRRHKPSFFTPESEGVFVPRYNEIRRRHKSHDMPYIIGRNPKSHLINIVIKVMSLSHGQTLCTIYKCLSGLMDINKREIHTL